MQFTRIDHIPNKWNGIMDFVQMNKVIEFAMAAAMDRNAVAARDDFKRIDYLATRNDFMHHQIVMGCA